MLIEQTKTKPQGTLEFQMIKQTETFYISPPTNIVEDGKWLLGVNSFEASNSVSNKTNKNNSFPITIPSHWQTKSAEKTFDELNELSELKSQKGIELHIKAVRE